MGRAPIMKYDYSKLRGRIREKCGTEKSLGEQINRTPSYLCNVFKGTTTFTFNDIENICSALDIGKQEIPLYFFAHELPKSNSRCNGGEI